MILWGGNELLLELEIYWCDVVEYWTQKHETGVPKLYVSLLDIWKQTK